MSTPSERLFESSPPPQNNRKRRRIIILSFVIVVAAVGVLAITLLPGYIRERAIHAKTANSLRQIGYALDNFADANDVKLTQGAIRDKSGKPLLSWRVAILPYIEQQYLYTMFNLNEPWDRPHNKRLISKMPRLYASSNEKTASEGKTFYRVFTGKGTLFPNGETFNLKQIADGRANVLLVDEAGEPVPWTKPDELAYDAKSPLPKFGGILPESDTFFVLMADGTVRKINRSISEQSLRAAILCADGTNPGLDWNEFESEK